MAMNKSSQCYGNALKFTQYSVPSKTFSRPLSDDVSANPLSDEARFKAFLQMGVNLAAVNTNVTSEGNCKYSEGQYTPLLKISNLENNYKKMGGAVVMDVFYYVLIKKFVVGIDTAILLVCESNPLVLECLRQSIMPDRVSGARRYHSKLRQLIQLERSRGDDSKYTLSQINEAANKYLFDKNVLVAEYKELTCQVIIAALKGFLCVFFLFIFVV